MARVFSRLTFHSYSAKLNQGFQWAMRQALSYVHSGGDPVGYWYEAALPGRDAFCMRDVSHQSSGAAAMGFSAHNLNMAQKFAASISEGKDYCCFWEINREGLPAPADYQSDENFWYNLPASFDLLDCCMRMYRWTGDQRWLDDPVLRRFYDLTMHEYIARWDKNGDGIPERAVAGSVRGIPSYDESGHSDALMMNDLLGCQAAGCDAYAFFCQMTGREKEAEDFRAEGKRIRSLLETQWWDEAAGRYFTICQPDGSLIHKGKNDLSASLIFDGALRIPERLLGMLDQIDSTSQRWQIEGLSHCPMYFYPYGQKERGMKWLLRLLDPDVPRREYPEGSFSVVIALAEGLLGLTPIWNTGTLQTVSSLDQSLSFAEMKHISVFGGEIDLRQEESASVLTNRTGREIQWKAGFDGCHKTLLVNGEQRCAVQETINVIRGCSFCTVPLKEGETARVEAKG